MEFKELFESFARPGIVTCICIRTERRAHIEKVPQVMAVKDIGLEGDHYNNPGGPRQITIIQAEHLQNVASYLNKAEIDPALARRNIIVQGINLLSLKGQLF